MGLANYTVPGIYYEPRPRAAPRPFARTDVVGFIGFETRVRDGSEPSQLIGFPPIGHAFQVDITVFQLPQRLMGGARVTVPAATNFVLSADPGSIPIVSSGSIKYALVAQLQADKSVTLVSFAGNASPVVTAAAVSDEAIAAALGPGVVWTRIADVLLRRSADGLAVYPVVIPRLPPTTCNDWADFQLELGGLSAVDDGTLLGRSVQAYFANGAARCHVATVRRPRFDDIDGLSDALGDMVGVAGASETDATGLERLLRIFEVAVVDAPDLYARNVAPALLTLSMPPLDRDACFRPCADIVAPTGIAASGAATALGPLFADADVLSAQRAMLIRCAPERWRVLLLFTAPVALDPAAGAYAPPDATRAIAWRQALSGAVDDLSASCGAFYHPWALTQTTIGAPLFELPPTALAAGVIARRDLARGPHIAPANERLIGVVGLSQPVDDDVNSALYTPPMNINPLRALAGAGVWVWGARTLSGDEWLRYLPVRRCLSAIERRACAALQPLVFEPNTPRLWFQITQAITGILAPVFEAGALRGDTPAQAYYVICDGTNNPSETILVGQVLCEVGVAIAAPAEFIVFRVGRSEGVVEVLE